MTCAMCISRTRLALISSHVCWQIRIVNSRKDRNSKHTIYYHSVGGVCFFSDARLIHLEQKRSHLHIKSSIQHGHNSFISSFIIINSLKSNQVLQFVIFHFAKTKKRPSGNSIRTLNGWPRDNLLLIGH